ncbi:MAG: cytochrome d ubiquinol oxidase subunit II [Cyanobacteria bacterium J06626_18]
MSSTATALALFTLCKRIDSGAKHLHRTHPVLMTAFQDGVHNNTMESCLSNTLVTMPVFSEQLRSRLLAPPLLYIFGVIPLLGLLLVGLLLHSLYRRQENTPIVWSFLLFALSFIGLGFIIFPAIIPPSVTIYEAAAAPSSLVFMLTFIGFLIPILLFYNIYNYIVFRGKIADESSYSELG